MAQTILYYPGIDIQDGVWLRNAILYWDEVSSIVPYENYPDFSPELLYLQELECVSKSINPSEKRRNMQIWRKPKGKQVDDVEYHA